MALALQRNVAFAKRLPVGFRFPPMPGHDAAPVGGAGVRHDRFAVDVVGDAAAAKDERLEFNPLIAV